MALIPWHKAVTPRQDLREGKPLDAAEFAVHLDHVRDHRAPDDYQKPDQFFERTYLTETLTDLAAQVVRRLSGERTETSAAFNMSTQFGGGKTHSLTLLYHLAKNGPSANGWMGVNKILTRAEKNSVPKAAVAVFVGSEFDSLTGRGGDDEPLRKTPWGEIAYQLGKDEGFSCVAEHEKQMIAPGGDVIRKFLPKDQPCLILMDEVMNYISINRKSGLSDQFYHFLENLTGVVRGQDNAVLVVSLPASELEMTPEDHRDFTAFKKMLDRVSKPIMMSAESETSEIIRRRLFEWDPTLTLDGKVSLGKEAVKTCKKYADWVKAHRSQVPDWFPVSQAQEAFEATYPFHPMVLSVFERKWQALPRFQRTRGVLKLLALWVSRAYKENYTGAHDDSLIGLGTAPLEDPFFRAAILEQLDEERLEGAITTDISGKNESHAIRLDSESSAAIKRARLHRKVATVILFESNGGRTHGTYATQQEVRLAVAEPDLDIGNVETVLESLLKDCYFLSAEGTSYKFSLQPNLNKIIADRRTNVPKPDIDERIHRAIEEVFNAGDSLKPTFFPEKSGEILDVPALSLIVLSPVHRAKDETTLRLLKSMAWEHGTSSRTYKSALIWAIADDDAALEREARTAIAWERISDEADQLRLDERQRREVTEKIGKGKRDLKEAVWRTYKHIAILDKNNEISLIDLGLIHSSAAKNITEFYLLHLKQKDIISNSVTPNFLVKNWPPAFKEWSTKSVRDAFFASPQFPRLLNSDAVKDTIARGVSNSIIAYVGKTPNGRYDPVHSRKSLRSEDVEISDEMFIVKEPFNAGPCLVSIIVEPEQSQIEPNASVLLNAKGFDDKGGEIELKNISWTATGGSISESGVFQAGPNEGSFTVTAAKGTIIGTSNIAVKKTCVPSLKAELKQILISPSELELYPGEKKAFTAKGLDGGGQEVLLDRVTWNATCGAIDENGIFSAGTDEGSFRVTASVGEITASVDVEIAKLCPKWNGEIPHQRWTQFYNRVLTKFAVRKGLKLTVSVEISDASKEEIEEMKVALRELGLNDEVEVH